MPNNNDRPGPIADENDRISSVAGTAVLERPPTEAPPAAPAAPPAEPLARRAKLSKKERKLRKDQQRNLDSWERYRALTDVLDEALELVDLADHKARFALVIMGALNALLFLLASQTDVFDAIPPPFRPAFAVVVGVYGLVAVFFVIQAIESLRPRKAQPQVRYIEDHGPEDHPVGLRFYEDILSRNVEEYRTAWRDLKIGALNAELAVQAHAHAQINKAKYGALRRLYLGLQVMTVMAVCLMAIGSWFVLSGKARRLDKKARSQVGLLGLRSAVASLPDPTRVADVGVREPSGVAFHPRSGHLFVVGDDGRLAELDGSGRKLASHALAGNLEDVAVHTPSGDLVVLLEQSSELVVLDPSGPREKGRWKLDHTAVLGQPRGKEKQGFEGLAFREDASQPGGGLFYLSHQREPAMLVAIAFDPGGRPGTVGAEAVRGRFPLTDYEDLTAVTYAAELDRLLVIADSVDQLLVVQTDGHVERAVALPGEQQEGVAVDGDGTIWVADDKDKSLLRLERGLEALRAQKSEGRGTGLRIPG